MNPTELVGRVAPPSKRAPATVRYRNLGRFVASVGLVLLVLFMALPGGGWQGIYAVGLRLLSLELIVLALVVWLAVAIVVPAWQPGTVLWPAFAVALIVFVVSLLASRTPRLGIDYLAYALLLAALYVLMQRLMAHPLFRVEIEVLCVALVVLIGGWFLLSVVLDWVRWWGLVGRITTPPLRPYFEGLTYGNPSAVMTMSVLLLCPAVAFLGFGTRWRRAAVVGLTVLVLVVTLLSGSRAGWLGLALGIAFTGLVWLAFAENRWIVGRLLRVRRVRAVVVAVAVGAAAAGVLFGPAILLRAGAGGEDLRGTLYLTSIRMFQDAPLLGTGPGTWVALRTAYTAPSEIDYYIPHAHSIYAQTLSEFGLVGMAAGLFVVACLAWLIRGAISGPDPVRRRWGWAALLGTAYFAAHQLLDFYPNMPAALFAFAVPIAWLDATAPRPLFARGFFARRAAGAATRRWLRPLGALVGVAAIVASVGWLARSDDISRGLGLGGVKADAGDWAGALPLFQAAASADPDMPPYQFALGIARANTGDAAGAAAAFERSVAVDDLPTAWLDLAAVRLGLGDTAGARSALDHALVLGTQQPGVNLAAGVLWLGIGDKHQARASLVLALQGAPSLAGDAWWRLTPGVSQMWPGVLDDAIAASGGMAAVDMALSAGDPARARAIAGTLTDPTERDLANLVIPAWSGDPAAIDGLYARARARPLDQATLGWCARIAARSGDEVRAADFRAWTDGPNPGSSVAGYEIRVTSGPSTRPAGITSQFYGHYTYRRPTPVDQLVSSLPHLEFR